MGGEREEDKKNRPEANPHEMKPKEKENKWKGEKEEKKVKADRTKKNASQSRENMWVKAKWHTRRHE